MSRSPTEAFRNPGSGRRRRRETAEARAGNGLDHDDGRIITVRQGHLESAALEGMQALVANGAKIFQRDNMLVRPVVKKAMEGGGREIAVPGLLPLVKPYLRVELNRAATWQRFTKEGEARRIDAPAEVAEIILHAVGEWPFRIISGVIATPTMRPDGSILSREGYDPATALYLLAPPVMPAIPDAPTWADAEGALTKLNGLLLEFPFADDVARSVAMSMLMTPVLRGALPPAVPLHIATAPVAGTGKSFLADIAAAIALGERCPVFTAAPGDPRETEKRLQGAALDGYPIIAIDNLNGELTGDFLAQLSSASTMTIRAMGGHPVTKVANAFTVFANGNNIVASQDLGRRTIRCGLDADMERPWERPFVGDPVATVLADRGPYVAAVLTIARAYLVAGLPERRPALGGFLRWSDMVRSAICWLGWTDPVASMEIGRAEDPTRQARDALFDAWHAELGLEHPYTVPELVEMAALYSQTPPGYVNREFREAALAVAQQHGTQLVSTRSLGKYLSANNNVRLGDLKLIGDFRDRKRPRWRLCRD